MNAQSNNKEQQIIFNIFVLKAAILYIRVINSLCDPIPVHSTLKCGSCQDGWLEHYHLQLGEAPATLVVAERAQCRETLPPDCLEAEHIPGVSPSRAHFGTSQLSGLARDTSFLTFLQPSATVQPDNWPLSGKGKQRGWRPRWTPGLSGRRWRRMGSAPAVTGVSVQQTPWPPTG